MITHVVVYESGGHYTIRLLAGERIVVQGWIAPDNVEAVGRLIAERLGAEFSFVDRPRPKPAKPSIPSISTITTPPSGRTIQTDFVTPKQQPLFM